MHGRNVRLSKEYDVCVGVCVHDYLCDCQNVAELCLWMQGDSPGCSGGLLCGLTIIEIGSKTRKNNEGKQGNTTYKAKIWASLKDHCIPTPPPPPHSATTYSKCPFHSASHGDVWLNDGVVIKQIM